MVGDQAGHQTRAASLAGFNSPKRFFGDARSIEDGGSQTILATALVETGARMDELLIDRLRKTKSNAGFRMLVQQASSVRLDDDDKD